MPSKQKITPVNPQPPKIEVDTNHFYETPWSPALTAKQVSELGLVAGQKVIAFMPPEDEWHGTISYHPERPDEWQWAVDLEDS